MDNHEFAEYMRNRTKEFGVRILKMYPALPKTDEARTVGRQLLRSATSVAANYRAACRARSKAEFFAKLCIVVEEADESLLWIEFLIDAGIVPENKLIDLKNEANEILSIV